MRIGQLVPGLFLTLAGIFLLGLSLFIGFENGGIIAVIYGIVGLVLGVIILVNREDNIEHVQSRVKGGKK